MLTIHVPDDLEDQIRTAAAVCGTDVDTFVLDAVAARLPESSAEVLPLEQSSAEQWVREFRAWAEDHPRRPILADDSRESIYADRGL